MVLIAIFLALLAVNGFKQLNVTPYLPVFFFITGVFQLYICWMFSFCSRTKHGTSFYGKWTGGQGPAAPRPGTPISDELAQTQQGTADKRDWLQDFVV